MNKSLRVYLTGILFIFVSNVMAETPEQPVDYVRPDIGGVSMLLTTTRPMVQLPHGYPQVTPVLNPGLNDSYVATKIYSFPAGGVDIMPGTGSVETDPGKIASSFDRDFETRTPYFYKGLLSSYDIWASYTVGHFAIFYRFDFPSSGEKHISIMMPDSGSMSIVSPTVVQGLTTIHDVPYYFYLEFSRPFSGEASWKFGGTPRSGKTALGMKTGLTVNFQGSGKEMVQVKVGLSFISLDQAKKNLDQAIDGWDFNRRMEETKEAWNNVLGKIQVEGGSKKQKIIFYTSLYRAEQNMMNITEDGRYYSGYDQKVHDSDGRNFYTHDQMWDTFRCEHPLQLLLDPKQQEDMIQSIVRMYEQWGWLPSFPRIWGEFPAMIGNHADEVITDAYFKGYRNFDVE